MKALIKRKRAALGCHNGTSRSVLSMRGFTLVELLVVVVIIGILASIALSGYLGMQLRAKRAALESNMHSTQVASESYAADSGGVYGVDPTSIAPYYPGGSSSASGSAGWYPDNPFTGQQQAPYQESISTSALIKSTRNLGFTQCSNGIVGDAGYNQCDNGSSYCVTGTDFNGFRVGSGSTTLIFSNQ